MRFKSNVSSFAERLRGFGYLDPAEPAAVGLALQSRIAGRAVSGVGQEEETELAEIAALRRFQLVHGLPPTGTVDPFTRRLLNTPRCGVSDVPLVRSIHALADGALELVPPPFFPVYPSGATITYQVRNLSGQFDEAFERSLYQAAFRTWANLVDVEFFEVEGPADFFIEWRTDLFPMHLGIAVAGTFIHFNAQHAFSDDRRPGSFDLFSLAAHEVGHVLGAPHSAFGLVDILRPSTFPTEITRLAREEECRGFLGAYQPRGDKGSFRNGLAAGDFDGLGREEVALVRRAESHFHILSFDCCEKLFVELGSRWQDRPAGNWATICAADLTGGGRDHLVAVDEGGNMTAFDLRNGVLVDLARSAFPIMPVKIVGGDFNADGRDECLAFGREDPAPFVISLEGGTLTVTARAAAGGEPSYWIDAVAADFSATRIAGLRLQEGVGLDRLSGRLRMFRQEEPGLLVEVAQSEPLAARLDGALVVAGELIQDLRAVPRRDMVVVALPTATGGGANGGFRVYEFDPLDSILRLRFTLSEGEASSDWRDLAIGDFDGDGREEIMAIRERDGGVFLFKVVEGVLQLVASNTDFGTAIDWRGIVTIRTGPIRSTYRDSGALVSDRDGLVHVLEYVPATGQIERVSTGRELSPFP